MDTSKKIVDRDTLMNWIEGQDPPFILDVRPIPEREDWYIPQSHHLDAYQRLNQGDESVLDEIAIPSNMKVVTVCAAGKTSLIAAELLSKKGYETYSLKGGMKAWNYAWDTVEWETKKTDVKIIQVRRLAKGCLSYVIGSRNEAVIVDASLDPDVYLNIAKEHNLTIRYVMDTHIHADYISRTRELASVGGAHHLFIDKAEVEYPFTEVVDQQTISFGNAEIKVLHTPGHTWESTSYLINGKVLLTGDTLFTDGVGRPDLKADHDGAQLKAGQLYDSLQEILDLPGDTVVFPTHIAGPVPFGRKIIMDHLSSLQTKLDLLNLSREQFIAATLKRIPPTPSNFEIITQLNKKGDFEGVNPADLEAGANHCAVG